MSEDKTNRLNNSRSFEERVFLCFDSMDARFDAIEARCERIETRVNSIDGRVDSIDGRVEKLEAKQYDTKPIWERALAEISEVSARLDQTNVRLDETNARMDQGFDQVRSEMEAGFAKQQKQTEHLVRDVYWQVDALNRNILRIQADQQYFNARLRDIEHVASEEVANGK